ncbi:MAG: FAD:protein FMN transferase [Sandaracinaceae bacterium]
MKALPVALAVVALASCSGRRAQQPEEPEPPAREAQAAAAPRGASSGEAPRDEPATFEPVEGEPVQRSRPLMGTIFQATVIGLPEPRAETLIAAAFDEIARLEGILSEWQADSEVSAINERAGEAPVGVGPETLRVVQAGLEVSRWTDGAFDLSWAALRGLYLFQPGEERVPHPDEVQARLAHVGWRRIALDEERRQVRLADDEMAIGTGGIAKGYALDRAAGVLRAGGARSFMLFGGGQVQVYGLRGDRPWRVGIQHPRDETRYIGFLEATRGSISTSGDYEHAFVDDEGTHWHHIIDLATGLPARRSVQVTLLAPEGIYADALSTGCFILGPERCVAMLAELPGPPEAVIIDPELRVWTTPGTDERVVWRVEREDGRLPGDPAYR